MEHANPVAGCIGYVRMKSFKNTSNPIKHKEKMLD